MNRTSKVTRALAVATLAVGLSACSGGTGASGASVTATVTVTASADSSAAVSPVPSPPPASSPPVPSSAPFTPLPSASVPGGRGVDATVRGQLALRGADAITVTSGSDEEVKALLLPYTVVRDTQGLICGAGNAPDGCSADQLREAIAKGGVFLAKVTIKDGVAVQIGEITKE